MKFSSGSIYHVYNRGNRQHKIFFQEKNYRFFLNKIKKEILPIADILAYCLMPNHYHLMLVVKDLPESDINNIPRKIGTLQSSFTRAINIQENLTGSLFQQKAKSIEIISSDDYHDETDYLAACFHYIHQNPLKAGLVNKLEDWTFSSFNEYIVLRKMELINLTIANEILDVDWENFYKESYNMIDDDIIDRFT